jgi:hypothetical protein
MKSVKLFVLLLGVISFGYAQKLEPANYRQDTCKIAGLVSTAKVFSKWMNLGDFENIKVQIFARDTIHAGSQLDSCQFVWGWQNGDYFNNAGKQKIVPSIECVADTFDAMVSTSFVYAKPALQSDGTFGSVAKYIDTVYSVDSTGFMCQKQNFAPDYAPLYRLWFQGLAQNKKTSAISARATITRRIAIRKA